MIEYITEEIEKTISKYFNGKITLSNTGKIVNSIKTAFRKGEISIHELSGVANHLLYHKFKPLDYVNDEEILKELERLSELESHEMAGG